MTNATLHKWEATGVTGYPITHPIVGQGDFYRKFKSFLELVADPENKFAQVFAAVAQWGVGKSRLGYEVVAQVNGTSKGWKVRGPGGNLEEACLFDNEKQREKNLALYIRYSQVAHEQLNLDNWFAPALYKALAPLARATFDSSIQYQIARQAFARLQVEGYDPAKLAAAMELDQHGDDEIYTDTTLATRLCNAAYEVLKGYGIEYVIIVLDELETAAERATAGIEADEARLMDGKAITMLRKAVESLGLGRREIEAMSKAVKEEDARARFPWLRFVALCSPAIGDELKEVQSTDRRFEIVDLARNAFSDVSAFVKGLEAEGRLMRSYPKGLVEAAYMMSGGNFGWFNVIMAVVDQVLQKLPPRTEPSIGGLFERAIQISNRIQRYVLDHRSLDEIILSSPDRQVTVELLFRQQPVAMNVLGADLCQRLFDTQNAYGEPIALRYQRTVWRLQDCTQILIQNRFQRQQGSGSWIATGIPEGIELERLLDDLSTLAIHELAEPGPTGTYTLLLPLELPDFLQLLDLIHPHPAVEELGRTLWTALVGTVTIPSDQATHIGPSVEMLRRLDIRLRKASTGMIFRDPQENEAYNDVIEGLKPVETQRALSILTGAMRLLDENWEYDSESAGFGDEVIAIRTDKNGLVDFKGLCLHPKGTALFAWANSDKTLEKVLDAVARNQVEVGRYPVVVLTTDYGLPERFAASKVPKFTRGHDYVVVLHLNSGEESALESVGMPVSQWKGFRLRREGFTTRFAERLNRIKTPAIKRVREWRHEASARGGIAWPIKPNGTLKEDARQTLVQGWRIVRLNKDGLPLGDVGTVKGLDYAALLNVLGTLGLSPAAPPKGYTAEDSARLWVGEDEQARPEVPGFLLRLATTLFKRQDKRLKLEDVRSEWLWGYTWDGNRVGDIFREWMATAVDLGWADAREEGKGQFSYGLVLRAKLNGDLEAARNWLDRGYRDIVAKLSEIAGPGVVDTYFRADTGSQYVKAKQLLDQAEQALSSLAVLEDNYPDLADRVKSQNWFIQVTKLRLQVREQIDQVFNKEKYEALPPILDMRRLNLLDDEKPMWERMRHGEHFSNAVREIAKRIRGRIPTLRDEMTAEVVAESGFPIRLFTRPLMKILDMVDEGLTGEDPAKSLHRAQQAEPDTLAHFLKELRVAAALDSLDAMAAEVGVNRQAQVVKPLAEIQGEVMTGFRELKERYIAARMAVEDLDQRLGVIKKTLVDPPTDFALPVQVSLEQVEGRPDLIRGELEEGLDETVDDLLDRQNTSMNLGNFSPLMRESRSRLLDSPERAIKGLEGKVRTIENAISKYRQDLIGRPVLLMGRRAINALRKARGEVEIVPLSVGDIENLSLRDGLGFILGRIQIWRDEGNGYLTATDVTFDAWQSTVASLYEGDAPHLLPEQMDALVREGFIKRVFVLP